MTTKYCDLFLSYSVDTAFQFPEGEVPAHYCNTAKTLLDMSTTLGVHFIKITINLLLKAKLQVPGVSICPENLIFSYPSFWPY